MILISQPNQYGILPDETLVSGSGSGSDIPYHSSTSVSVLSAQHEIIRRQAEKDFFFFINLVSPHLYLGSNHKELCEALMSDTSRYLVLYPRGHLKSTLTQHLAAWWLVREPWLTILYLSGSSALSKTALGEIKRILASETVETYWKGMVNRNMNKRAMWREDQIKTDHPSREERGIRDPSILAIGVGSVITGFHCDRLILDDLVNDRNSTGPEGRAKIESSYSLGNSLLNPGGIIRAVGTYYDSSDLYHTIEKLKEENTSKPVYQVIKKEVEDKGDGTGTFLWARAKNHAGVSFGFDKEVLSNIESNYINKKLYRSQYYNNCVDTQSAVFHQDMFKYYDRKFIRFVGMEVFYQQTRLSIFTAMDFAWTDKKTSDDTAIDTIGIDYRNNIYHLDSVSFKTTDTDIMAENLIAVFNMYHPLVVGMEITTIQKIIIDSIKTYCQHRGILLPVKNMDPQKRGSKIGYIETLKAYYDNGWIYHDSVISNKLENQLLFLRETGVHDDVANAFRDAVALASRPMDAGYEDSPKIVSHPRFGGVHNVL